MPKFRTKSLYDALTSHFFFAASIYAFVGTAGLLASLRWWLTVVFGCETEANVIP